MREQPIKCDALNNGGYRRDRRGSKDRSVAEALLFFIEGADGVAGINCEKCSDEGLCSILEKEKGIYESKGSTTNPSFIEVTDVRCIYHPKRIVGF